MYIPGDTGSCLRAPERFDGATSVDTLALVGQEDGITDFLSFISAVSVLVVGDAVLGTGFS